MSKNLPILAIPATLNVSELMTVRGGAVAGTNAECDNNTITKKKPMCNLDSTATTICESTGGLIVCTGGPAVAICSGGPAVKGGMI